MLYGQKLEHFAERIATILHSKQYRRDGKTPYIEHPRRVVERIRQKYPKNSVLVAIAWLHDVLEDTPMTLDDLQFFDFPNEVIVSVFVLTKGKNYNVYLSNVMNYQLARLVKIEDILDNLNDDPSPRQKKKYIKALQRLGYKDNV